MNLRPALKLNVAFHEEAAAAKWKFFLEGHDCNLTLPPNATRERDRLFAEPRYRAK